MLLTGLVFNIFFKFIYFLSSLIFMNDEIGEFWYDLKLISLDPLPFQFDPIEVQVGKYEDNDCVYFYKNIGFYRSLLIGTRYKLLNLVIH